MTEKKSSLAVIPARGGSKRIPDKNIRELGGKKIIAYTIEAALESGVFSRVVVSTDSERIAGTAVELGAEVPFIRRADLADDHTPSSLATLDALENLDPGVGLYDYVVQLMVNCPLRNAQDIRDSFRNFIESNADSQISVTDYGWLNPWWAMKKDEQDRLEPVFTHQLKKRSQELPELYCPTGAIWIAKSGALRREKTFYTADRKGWYIPWQRAVDIDTEEDWLLAEMLIKNQRKSP
ncbi:MAG: acylneuraminate cytidylyltransferase family protein [Candidatus Glassbacteria bacterium]|nr:acylneuraminate cytidylyltransferase family protein [Candidatus Glassbacteria bacterium]